MHTLWGDEGISFVADVLRLEVIVAVLTEEGTGDGAVILECSDGEGASLLQGTEAVMVEVSPRADVDTRKVLHAV